MTGFNLDLSKFRILIIEDSIEYQKLIAESLGNSSSHVYVENIAKAKKTFEDNDFDCLLIDISLPDGTGFDFLQSQKNITCPVIILSASSEIGNKALGFSLGIQDYIEKPFQPMELAIRVKAKIDFYTKKHEANHKMEIGNLRFDLHQRKFELILNNQTTSPNLSRKEIDLLYYFIKNIDRVLSREQILDHVWGNDNFVLERSVDSAIASLRKKLVHWNHCISTVYGIGYQLSAIETTSTLNADILETFTVESEKQIRDLEQSIKASDWKRSSYLVHKLKGSFSLFTDKLSPLADKIETSASTHEIQDLLKEFAQSAINLRTQIISKRLSNAS